VIVETKEQSKDKHSPNKPKQFKEKMSACQKADENGFPGRKGVLMVQLIQEGTQ
jgi:hypothetical protein